MNNVRAQQAIMFFGWLVITVLTINAVIVDPMAVFAVFNTPWSALITTDLMVEIILVCVYIHWDSTRRGKNPWVWILPALLLGAICTLGYLLVRSLDKDAPPLLPREESRIG